MHSVCNLCLFTEDDRLLIGRPQFSSKHDLTPLPQTNSTTPYRKAMSTQTNDLPDINSQARPKKHP